MYLYFTPRQTEKEFFLQQLKMGRNPRQQIGAMLHEISCISSSIRPWASFQPAHFLFSPVISSWLVSLTKIEKLIIVILKSQIPATSEYLPLSRAGNYSSTVFVSDCRLVCLCWMVQIFRIRWHRYWFPWVILVDVKEGYSGYCK